MVQVPEYPEFEMVDIASCRFSDEQTRRLCTEVQKLTQVRAARVVSGSLYVTVDMGRLEGRQLTNAFGVLQSRVNTLTTAFWRQSQRRTVTRHH